MKQDWPSDGQEDAVVEGAAIAGAEAVATRSQNSTVEMPITTPGIRIGAVMTV